MRLVRFLASLALASSLAGCDFYFSDDDDDCLWPAEPGGAPAGLRNPDTGVCESFGGGGGGCGPVALGALPDWGWCVSHCSGLDEGTCLGASGCRAIYVDTCPPNADCAEADFIYSECWETAPSGPVQGGGCTGLDAYECSRHDDCVAYHLQSDGGCADGTLCESPPYGGLVAGRFAACGAEPEVEPGCYSDAECADGYRCTAAEECLPPPGCDQPGVACPAVCYGRCVPDQAQTGSCHEEPACDAAPPACPAGTVAGVADGCYTGFCIPFAACTPPIDPGSCFEPAMCRMAEPTCPAGSHPGVANGCYTGYCIPADQCEQPVPCDELGTEVACVTRADCAPVYQGVDCSCDANGCTCADWLYQSCQPGVHPVFHLN